MRFAWGVAVIASAVIVAGCASVYTDSAASGLSDNEVAILSHPDPVHGGIVIEQIDGRWRGTGLINTYRLSPGKHSMGVRVNLPFYRSDKVVRWIDVKPGGRYSVEAATDVEAERWGFWVVDSGTRKRVDYEGAAD